jgi:hypothetical protein
MFGLPLLNGTMPIGDYRVFYDVETDSSVGHHPGSSAPTTIRDGGGDPVKTMGIEQAEKD